MSKLVKLKFSHPPCDSLTLFLYKYKFSLRLEVGLNRGLFTFEELCQENLSRASKILQKYIRKNKPIRCEIDDSLEVLYTIRKLKD